MSKQAQIRYFALFSGHTTQPLVHSATLEKEPKAKGWALKSNLRMLNDLTQGLHEPGPIERILLDKGFVELPQVAFEAATDEPWRLYAYRSYINSQAYTRLLLEGSGKYGNPDVLIDNPSPLPE